jgi:oligopeptide transport system ATP-binding protein
VHENHANIVEVKNLCKYYPVDTGVFGRSGGLVVRALDDVSLTIKKGETLGIVGESGSGKTTLGETLLYLTPPTRGKVLLGGRDMSKLTRSQMRAARRKYQIVFQDPYSSLNPRMTVGSILMEPMLFHGIAKQANVAKKVGELLEMVGLKTHHASRYPHEFSGGQRQRIAIARALSVGPEFIVCDEPVSSLDVSVQAQILNLLSDLKKQLSLTYLFISHDLSVVRHMADRIGVMYLGKLVELSSENDLFTTPLHPYTMALLSAVPVPDVDLRDDYVPLLGDLPNPINPPAGCHFHPRCPRAMKICSKEPPELRDHGNGHYCACHLYDT